MAQLPIGVIDFETDPFLYGRTPKPFAACFKSDSKCIWFWGSDCVHALLCFLDRLPPHRIYAHNGGKFDFFYLLDHLDNPIKVIRSRIAKAKLGKHELRDSWCIIPIPLAQYQKDEIDYALFEADVREAHKDEIIKYLINDCVYLHKLVTAFVDRFGVQLTVGGTALRKLREFHPFPSMGKHHDDKMRPFYYGGRVECFQTGEHHGSFKVYDVNSMYPHVMRNFRHPIGGAYSTYRDYAHFRKWGYGRGNPYFLRIRARSRGAFPLRDSAGRLQFPHCESEFTVTSHEFETAMALGLVDLLEFGEAVIYEESISFGDYVDTFSKEKIDAKKSGDKISELFAKFMLNSAYGKTGQNPEHYKDFWIRREDEDLPNGPEWELEADHGNGEIWSKPSERQQYFDVAIAGSITGAARAELLKAIHHSKNLLYCDTDSVICEELEADLDAHRLGAWKLEAEADTAYIMAKKLYLLTSNGEKVKAASKGFNVKDWKDLLRIAQGEEYNHFNDAPNFKLSGGANFVKRRISTRSK